MTDQAHVLRQMARFADGQQGGARVIAVSSGKGGVGKTSLSVNLGVALVSQGQRVALVDADVGLANVDIVLGLNSPYSLRHVLDERRSLTDVLLEGPGGMQVVVGGSGVQELNHMSRWQLEKFVRTLDTMDSMFDTVLIDTGAGLGPHVLAFVLSCPETIIVATPDPSAVADAYAMIKTIASHNKRIRLLVAVNMVRSLRQGEQTFQRLSQVAGRFLGVDLEYIGAVPVDEVVVRAAHRQTAFVLESPRSAAGRAIEQMARRLADGSVTRGELSGLGAVIRRMFFGRR